jgi:hypothetical protein
LVSKKQDQVDKENLQEVPVEEADFTILSIVDKFLAELDEEKASSISFAKLEKQLLEKSGGEVTDFTQLLEYKSVIPSSLCSKCLYAKGCPFYIKSRVCFYLTDPFKLRRRIFECLEDLKYFMTSLLTQTTLFTPYQSNKDVMLFLFAAYLYYRIFDDQLAKNVPTSNRYKSKLAISSHKKSEATREEIHRRWQVLKIPNQENKEYYPHT